MLTRMQASRPNQLYARGANHEYAKSGGQYAESGVCRIWGVYAESAGAEYAESSAYRGNTGRGVYSKQGGQARESK